MEVTPDLDVELPERTKPVEAMQSCGSFPTLPDSIVELLPEDQMKLLIKTWLIASSEFANCKVKHEALRNWIRVCKQYGHLVITIPEEEMYEHGHWPSRYNDDHKWSFTMTGNSSMPKSINLLEMLIEVKHIATVEKIEVIRDFYYPNTGDQDQTLHPAIECAIEFIIKKV